MEDVKPTTSIPTSAPFNWWDLLPLVEEPRRRAKAHWTPKGIIMAHPTKPLILHYPNPPNTSESKQLPSHRRIFENDAFSAAKVLSVDSSGDLVFAYFPSSNGSNAGACCIWENMQLKEFWTAEQGEAIIECWWLGEARQ
ncbi:12138_t:CDS:2, partial [Acaulospora colombiana]